MSIITKTALLKSVSDALGISAKQAGQTLDAVVDAIKTETEAGNTVRIPGFGQFSVKTRAARVGRNPRTGEAVQIAESRTLAFKPSKSST